MNTSGERLEFIRKEILRIKQSELAELLGVTQATISAAENNSGISKKLTKAVVSKVEGLRTEWLEYGSGAIFEGHSKYHQMETVVKKIVQQNTNSPDNKITVGNKTSTKEITTILQVQIDNQAREIERLTEQLRVKDEQLKAKDEQIKQLMNQLFNK